MAKGKNRKRTALIVCAVLSLVLAVAIGFNVWKGALTPSGGPLIGISSDTAWHSRLGLSNTTYEAALARVGARIWEFRPGDASTDEILKRIDGLILAGGYDVDPAGYGGDPSAAETVDTNRDSFEFELIEKALALDLPMLGICRGLQILNVAHGGTLRNIRADARLGPAHGGELTGNHQHRVLVEPNSRWAAVVGSGALEVNTYHGQAIARLGLKLVPAARTDDGVIEAIERPDLSFVLATQWHPEILSLRSETHLAVFYKLVEAATDYAKRRFRR
ncbi:MAG: gamma-glutamyl-gamma-aminobutyrate hydrolase family protein [Deltaproteobacteria bacterium]|nr:gamma-glutamyl-gamma-aminobutyrate hydrolase family protein [Deltaproteobacteria bacterium]